MVCFYKKATKEVCLDAVEGSFSRVFQWVLFLPAKHSSVT